MDQRTIALLLACLLGSIVMLGSEADPPVVSISQVPGLEDGMRVEVIGILVDLWTYDSGTESLILAEPNGPSTLKIVSSPARRPQPSRYADLGDELSVLGELSKSDQLPLMFTTSDEVHVSRESEDVLTVDMLKSSWRLFEGDHIRLRGVLSYDGLGETLRLFNLERNCSLALAPGQIDAAAMVGSRVIVTGTLQFDLRLLSLRLLVSSIVPDG